MDEQNKWFVDYMIGFYKNYGEDFNFTESEILDGIALLKNNGYRFEAESIDREQIRDITWWKRGEPPSFLEYGAFIVCAFANEEEVKANINLVEDYCIEWIKGKQDREFVIDLYNRKGNA